MNNTTWLGSAAVALVLGVTAAVAQNAPAASDKRGDSPQAQAPAKSERADDRQKERSAQDNDSRSGAKDAQAPSRDDKAGQKQAQEPRDESKQPARQSQEQDRTQRPPANAQRQDREQDQKQARQPSDQKDAKQPEQKDAKQPADQKQQQTRDQQKQDSDRAAQSKDGAKQPQQQSQQPAPAKAPTNQAAQPAPATKGDTAQDRQNQPATGQAANQPSGSTTTTTQISEQQRTQVRETLSRDRTTIARENQNLNIQVNVGVALPANVRMRSLPPDIVRIAPQYRGYSYTVVQDEIVILEPRTRRVVEVLEEPGRARQTTSRVSSTSRQVLTDDQRQTLRQGVQRTTTTGSTAASGGFDANCLTLQNLPDEMASANPDLRNYKMLTIGRQLVLVDPQQQTVVEVID